MAIARFTNFSLIFSLVIVFTVFQDFIHSYFNHYSFYLSESLLFKSFWLLFLPIFALQSILLNFLSNRLRHKSTIYILGILLPAILHLFFFPALIWVLSEILFNHTYAYSKTLDYTFSEDFYKNILIYGSAAIVHFYLKRNYQKQEDLAPKFLRRLTVNTGRKYVTIAVEDIIYIAASAPYIMIHTQDEQYLYSNTLKWIQNELNPQQFIRIHKSIIINKDKVVSYHSRLNGDYDIMMVNQASVRLSRNYSTAFKTTYTEYSA